MSASPGNGLAAKWLPEHDNALRKYLGMKMSFTQAAAAINGEFLTSYSRNAAIGRGNRIGLKSSCPKFGGQRKPRVRKGEATAAGIVERTQRRKAAHVRPVFACDESGLRIADVVPLHLSLLDLDQDMCRWPYGDGPFTFCGCRTFDGSSYCEPHVALAAKPMQGVNFNQTESQRAAHRKLRVPAIISLYRSEDAA